MRKEASKQPAHTRISNFFEVALGYSSEQAVTEAKRCLQCKDAQCVKGCPVEIDIPAFIACISQGDPEQALKKLHEKNNLPAVCGRVCPQEDQCEKSCILKKKGFPINIGALERFAADFGKVTAFSPVPVKPVSQKVAVVGSGPAGLTCAADLAKMCYDVTLFESLHIPGGVLSYGIPEFRLPKAIVKEEIDSIGRLGVRIQTDMLIGRTLTIEELFQSGFKAVFLGLGAGLPQFLGIPGENLNRAYSANEFLTRVNLMKAYRPDEYATPINIGHRTVVVGAGNVAFDSARCARRFGSEVTIVYRRTEQEMPARLDEIANAKEEGVLFSLLTQPVRVQGDTKGFVRGLECIKMSLTEPDESGRRKPVPIKDSNFTVEADTLIVAIGQRPNPLLPKAMRGLTATEQGTIVIDTNYMTALRGVFAGGDITTGADTVIAAMGAGKRAAQSIDKYLQGRL